MAAGDQMIPGSFTFTETSIEGVVVVDVKSYGDDPAFGIEWPPLSGDDSFDQSKILLSEKD